MESDSIFIQVFWFMIYCVAEEKLRELAHPRPHTDRCLASKILSCEYENTLYNWIELDTLPC